MNQPLRILLLEDNPADAELNERILRKAGLTFESRRTDDEAGFLAALAGFRPDLVLADYHLPSFDGMRALALASEKIPDLPFIFVTGNMGEEMAVESLHKGADDYILKDRISRLPSAVERALNQSQQHRQLRSSESALRESEARFRAMVEASTDCIWRIDALAQYTYVSPRVFDLLGYTPDEMLGRSRFELTAVAQDQQSDSQFAELFRQRKPFALLENFGLHKDGHKVVMETSGSPIYDAAGQYLGYQGIDRDVTERNRLRAELETARQHEQEARQLASMARISGDSPSSATENAFGLLRLRESDPKLFGTLVLGFMRIQDMALEQRVLKVDHPIRAGLQDLAEQLGMVKAGPRDAIEIYVQALNSLSQDIPPQKAQAYAEESRLLVLELMGHLVSFYRKHFVGSSRQTTNRDSSIKETSK